MSNFTVGDLLSFEKMVAESVLKFVYFVGLIGIVIFGLVTFFGSFAVLHYSGIKGIGTMVAAVIGTGLGCLIWRVTCELWLLGFRIYDRLGEIRDATGSAAH